MTQEETKKTSTQVYQAVAKAELNNVRNIANIAMLDALRKADNSPYVSLAQANRLNVLQKASSIIADPTTFLKVIEDGKFATKTTIEAMKQI